MDCEQTISLSATPLSVQISHVFNKLQQDLRVYGISLVAVTLEGGKWPELRHLRCSTPFYSYPWVEATEHSGVICICGASLIFNSRFLLALSTTPTSLLTSLRLTATHKTSTATQLLEGSMLLSQIW